MRLTVPSRLRAKPGAAIFRTVILKIISKRPAAYDSAGQRHSSDHSQKTSVLCMAAQKAIYYYPLARKAFLIEKNYSSEILQAIECEKNYDTRLAVITEVSDEIK
ncbi:hypothetical protein ACJJTC_000894 [Scirpophaga incertulas]